MQIESYYRHENYIHKFMKILYLRGYCTPKQKFARFVPHLKIINTLLKYDICASYSKLSKELKK